MCSILLSGIVSVNEAGVHESNWESYSIPSLTFGRTFVTLRVSHWVATLLFFLYIGIIHANLFSRFGRIAW